MRNISGCNVAVIGGAGFLGSHLVDHLIEDRGCRVAVVDNLVVGKREFVHPKAKFYHHDITGSEEYLRRLFAAGKVRFVFNYAAYPYIPDSFDRPLHVFGVNANGAMKVINAAQAAGCEGILQVSSAEIYGEFARSSDDERLNVRITEDELVSPHSTYGCAKAAIDFWVQSRWREAKTPCIALRQFNCVGARETHPYVVPEIISQLSKQFKWCPDPSKPIESGEGWACNGIVYLGNNSTRDFMHAKDAVRIAVELLERGEFGEVYNLGSETGIKVYDLAAKIGKLMGFAEVKVVEDPARKRPWEIWSLLSSNEKINSVVGNRQLLSLDDALKDAIDWFNQAGRAWPWEK